MKRLLLISLWLCAPSFGAITLVQTVVCHGLASPSTCAVTGTVAGNAIITSSSFTSSVTVSGVSDGTNGAYTQDAHSPELFSGQAVATVWYYCNGAGGSITISYSVSGVPGRATVIVQEVSGLDTTSHSSCRDTSVAATGSGNTPSAGSVTTTVANEYLYGHMSTASITNGFAATNSYNLDTPFNDVSGGAEHRIVSSTGTYADGWTNSNGPDYAAILVAFKAPSGGTTCGNFISLMGAGCQ